MQGAFNKDGHFYKEKQYIRKIQYVHFVLGCIGLGVKRQVMLYQFKIYNQIRLYCDWCLKALTIEFPN